MTQSKHNEISADRARLAEILSHLSPSALVKLLYFAMGLSARRDEDGEPRAD